MLHHHANYHQHSTFCDGKESMEFFVKEAISLGFDSLGFSSHAPAPFANEELINFDWMLKPANLNTYVAEFERLKACYQSQITLLLALEADYFSPILNAKQWQTMGCFDYLISSVHMLKSSLTACGYAPIDAKGVVIQQMLEEHSGSVKALYRLYFDTIAQMVEQGGFDVIGHLDLINKGNQNKELFDFDDNCFISCVKDVYDLARQKNILVEINTGYMSRKGFKEPFPRYSLIDLGINMGIGFVLTSDCHQQGAMNFAFDEVKTFMKSRGAPLYYYQHGHFRPCW